MGVRISVFGGNRYDQRHIINTKALNPLKDWLLVAMFKFVALFPISLLRALGRVIGQILWLIQSDARFVTETNLKLCYPDMPAAEREQLAKESLKHLGMMALEVAPSWHWQPARSLSHITSIEGLALFEQAAKEERGVILLGPHIGNWEMLGIYMGAHFDLTSMFQPPENQALNEMIYNARVVSGSKLVPTNVSGVKALLKTLKKGNLAGVLPDQVPPAESGEFSSFFGQPALTMTMVYNLVQRTGADVVFGMALREDTGSGCRLVFRAAPEGIYSKDQAESLAALNQGVEETVALAPAQYQWEYKRFKKQPNGEKLYRKAK